MATIAILGTMDTKGQEHAFVAEQIRKRGHKCLVIDVGILEDAQLKPDITRYDVAQAAGKDLKALVAKRDRGEAVAAMSGGAPSTRARVAGGGRGLRARVAKRVRGEAVAAMSEGAPIMLSRLAAEKKIDGVISLGGGG